MDPTDLIASLKDRSLDGDLARLYGPDPAELEAARRRLVEVATAFVQQFPQVPATLFTAPGRTELGGNHTDHQRGRVLAAAVNLDTVACAGPNGTDEVRIHQVGRDPIRLDTRDLAKREAEVGSSIALVRGVARGVQDRGCSVAGIDAVIDSAIPVGSGLSSSAAFEVLLTNIFATFFCEGALTPIQIAQIGQFAENEYFGKPSGLRTRWRAPSAASSPLTSPTPTSLRLNKSTSPLKTQATSCALLRLAVTTVTSPPTMQRSRVR